MLWWRYSVYISDNTYLCLIVLLIYCSVFYVSTMCLFSQPTCPFILALYNPMQSKIYQLGILVLWISSSWSRVQCLISSLMLDLEFNAWSRVQSLISSSMLDLEFNAWSRVQCLISSSMLDLEFNAWSQVQCLISSSMLDLEFNAWSQVQKDLKLGSFVQISGSYAA